MTIERYMPGDTEGIIPSPEETRELSPRDRLDLRYNKLTKNLGVVENEMQRGSPQATIDTAVVKRNALVREREALIGEALRDGLINDTEMNDLARFWTDNSEAIRNKDAAVLAQPQYQRIDEIVGHGGLENGLLQDRKQALAVPESSAPRTVRLRYETDYGTRETDVPVNPVEQRKILTDALTILEKTREPEGSLAYSNAIKKFNYMVLAMGQHSEYKEQAGKLIEEYQARTSFHKIFLNYERAGDIKGVKQQVDQLLDKWMDTLFVGKEYRAVRYALQYYKENGENFVGMNDLDHLKDAIELAQQHKDETREVDPILNLMTQDNFRKAAIVSIKDDFKKKKEAAEMAKVVASPEDKDKIHPEEFVEPIQDDLEAMCNLAERFWNMSGLRMAQVQTYEKVKKEADNTLHKTGEVEWVDGSVTGGNFHVRDLERFKDRIITRKEALKPHMDVFDDLDGIKEVQLDSIDFITYMEGKMKEVDKAKGAFTSSKLDFRNDFWESYKFYNLDSKDQPMFQWSLLKLQFPGEHYKDFQEYIQEPNDENFLKAGKGFKYLAKDRFKASEKLIKHRVKFLKSDEATRYGLEKPSLAGFDNMIEHWGRELDLEPEKQKEIVDELLGSGAWADVTIFWSHIKGNQMLLSLFWEFIWGILKEGAKPV